MSDQKSCQQCVDCGGETLQPFHKRCGQCYDPSKNRRRMLSRVYKYRKSPANVQLCRMCTQVQVDRVFCDDCYHNMLKPCTSDSCDGRTVYTKCGRCYRSICNLSI